MPLLQPPVNCLGMMLGLRYSLIYYVRAVCSHFYCAIHATTRLLVCQGSTPANSAERRHMELALSSACLFSAVFSWGLFFFAPQSTQGFVAGLITNVVAVSFYASPLSDILNIIKTRDASSIDSYLSISLFFNGAMWVLYGYYINQLCAIHRCKLRLLILALANRFTMIPNAICASQGLLQLLLRFCIGVPDGHKSAAQSAASTTNGKHDSPTRVASKSSHTVAIEHATNGKDSDDEQDHDPEAAVKRPLSPRSAAASCAVVPPALNLGLALSPIQQQQPQSLDRPVTPKKTPRLGAMSPPVILERLTAPDKSAVVVEIAALT